jgi:hypothetical protein
MATPRKRPSSGFSEKPAEKSTEKEEIKEFLEVMTADVFEEIEKAEEVIPEITPTDVFEEVEKVKEVILEITPTEDPGPRFVETPPKETKPEPPKVELKKPKRPARNTPRFSRTVK